VKLLYWCLLCLSSVLYALPFLFSSYIWWLIFIFPLPFLYVATQENISFKHGFIWGLLTFLLQMIGGLCVVTYMAHVPLIGFAVAISIIIVQAFFVGVLFWLSCIFNYCKTSSCFYTLCKAVGVLFIFIVWVDRYSLWMFGVLEGYPLMHPLLVLGNYPSFLWLLPIIGKNWLTLLFFLPSTSIITLFLYKNKWALLFCILTFLPWIVSFFITVSDNKPLWLQTIKPIPYITINQNAFSENSFKIALHDIAKKIEQYNECDVLFHAKKCVHVIFGASRIHNNICYNSLVWLYDGRIQYCFDKCHAMILSERLPFWLNYVKKMYFFNDKQPIVVSSNIRNKIIIKDMIEFVPYLCSEFFFSEYPDDIFFDTPILVLVNDSIFLHYNCAHYICKLLQLLTQCKAIQWQREIVYISYSQSLFFGKTGNVIQLH